MAENEQTGRPESASSTERQFAVQRIYVKDVSFESPHSPDVFRGEWQPTQEINITNKINKLQDNIYEVVLAVTVTAKLGEKTAFIVEVQQAGIFAVAGFSEQELGPMLAVYCPTLLYPYARETVSDLVIKGSFPQLYLQHVNFDVLYAQRQQAAMAEAQRQAAPPPSQH
jgi:preprotein translocase subunit SecB